MNLVESSRIEEKGYLALINGGTDIDNGTDQVRRGYESTRSKSRISHCGHKAVSVSITFLTSCSSRKPMPFVSRTIQVSGNRKRSAGLGTENGNPLRPLERAESADLQPGANPLIVRCIVSSSYRVEGPPLAKSSERLGSSAGRPFSCRHASTRSVAASTHFRA
jgi:hypothetical protein